MAPSLVEADSISTRHELRKSSSNEPPLPPPPPSAELNKDADLAKSFKSDLTKMRGLVTCTICDQLLYEPWTLGCGHTYCYSCLCQWFKQHKHKKTCPDCRTPVKVMPAPSFTIKQMIEIFINRVELLPADETVAQHRENIEAERMAVDVDRTTEDGLFKGSFKPSDRVHRQWIEDDNVWVCSGCHHEVMGGEGRCENCHIRFEDLDSDDGPHYDMDSFDEDEQELYEFDMDMDEGLSDRTDDDDDLYAHRSVDLEDPGNFFHSMAHRRRRHFGAVINLESGDSDGSEEEDDDESVGSLREFIDSDQPRDVDRSSRAMSENSHITIESSEEDSDDESIVPLRRPVRRPLLNRLSSASADESDGDSLSSISRGSTITNQHGHHGESENEVFQYEYDERDGYSALEDSDDHTGESNSSTILGMDDENDFRTRDSNSSTPRRSTRGSSMSSHYGYGMNPSSDNETDNFDGDGDVEMSVSPDSRATATTTSSSGSERSETSSRRAPRFSSVELGPAAVFHEEDDGDGESDDSDESVRPPVRRRRLSYNRNPVTRSDDEDVTLTQLFTRPPTGQRTSPSLDGRRILEWYASRAGSPGQPYRSQRRTATRPTRLPIEVQRRVERASRGARSRNFTQ